MNRIVLRVFLLFCAASPFSQPNTKLKTHERHMGAHWQAIYADSAFLNIGLVASFPINSIVHPTVNIPCHDRAASVQAYRWIVRGGERLTWSIRFDNEAAEFRSVLADAHRSTVSEVPLLAGDLNRIIHAKKVEFGIRFYPNTRMTVFSFFPQGLDLQAAESSCPALRSAL